jgi:hypothetical protein
VNPDSFGNALSWIGDASVVEQLDVAFAADCETALEDRISPKTAEIIDRLDARGRRRLLRAPEITRRLLFPATAPADDVERLVAEAAMVELALSGTEHSPPIACWSALGDVQLLENSTLRWWPQLAGAGTLPLDFGSPWAQRIDLSGHLEIVSTPRPSFTDAEIDSVHRRLGTAMDLLQTISPTLPRFVFTGTCVLVLQIDPTSRAVASGTNGRYIGRSFIANPHSQDATHDCLAEAIVHEAIHGLIFRESLRRPWVDGPAALEVPRVESPWTGRPLPVRPYLEASFVWFGLVHLWALALRHGVFDYEAAHGRLLRSMRGFCRGALIDRTRPWSSDVRADVLETIDCLQRRILDALGDVK